jgi:phosphoribosylanthranilate isomerase
MPSRVKICGIRSASIMRVALDAGADDIGLVFFGNSPRNVTLNEAAALADIARGRARIVVLTVDADDAMLAGIVQDVKPGLLQLQGAETPQRVAAIKARFSVPVMKAIGVATRADAERSLAYEGIADAILFDAKPPKDAALPGGNGLAFEWSILNGIAGRTPWMLAGGLNAANVAAAIRVTGAPTVDVSSAVESTPGIKDPDRIRAFISAVKNAA